ncbi:MULTISPECIES: hypothetical protein [unclassified Rhizobium]
MESRFGRRAMVIAMIVGLLFSILYGLSGTHRRSPPANPATANDIAK